MPIRKTKQHSERGSIKDLVANVKEPQVPDEPPTSSEIRLKKLFEYAQMHKDQKMQLALGFITTDYIHDKDALPLSAYRIKQIVDDIKAKSPGKIERLQTQFEDCFAPPLSDEAMEYLAKFQKRIKTASSRRPPAFRKAREL